MRQLTIRSVVTAIAVVLVSASVARAQSETSTEVLNLNPRHSWEGAQLVGSSWPSASKRKLIVVTVDQPQRRQRCRVESFTTDKLVCSHAVRGSRTYAREQVLALILPGDGHLKLWLALGFNGGMGAAIWGTVVLAATGPAGAAATAFAALFFFGAAGAVLIGDDHPDQLLYLSPGQKLSRKLGYVQD